MYIWVSNYVNLLAKTATMRGFNSLQMWDRFGEAFADLRRWAADGTLVKAGEPSQQEPR